MSLVNQNRSSRGSSTNGPDLVLSDWAIGFENFPSDPLIIATELMMHALLYRRIFLQDESVAVSKKLARAFVRIPRLDADRILNQIFNTRALHILTLSSWPEDLAEVFHTRPIYARALYIKKYGARLGGDAFEPTKEQLEFYDRIDPVLQKRRRLVHAARAPADI